MTTGEPSETKGSREQDREQVRKRRRVAVVGAGATIAAFGATVVLSVVGAAEALAALVVTLAGLAFSGYQWLWVNLLKDDLSPLEEHVGKVLDNPNASEEDLSWALEELRTELAARQVELKELNERLKNGEQVASISTEALTVLDNMMGTRFARTERTLARIERLSFRQGVLWAAVGSAVTLLVGIFAAYLTNFAGYLLHPWR